MSVWALGDNDSQCSVSDCNKCTDLVQDADSGEAVQEWGQGVHGNSVLTAQFVSEPRDRQRQRENGCCVPCRPLQLTRGERSICRSSDVDKRE